MKNLLVGGIACFALAAPAYAETQWYILWGSTGRCVEAITQGAPMKSPAALESALRSMNEFKNTDVYRDEDGKIGGASVVGKDGMAVAYFPSKKLCERTRANALTNGIITDPEELK